MNEFQILGDFKDKFQIKLTALRALLGSESLDAQERQFVCINVTNQNTK